MAQVSRVVIHHLFNSVTLNHDFALLQVEDGGCKLCHAIPPFKRVRNAAEFTWMPNVRPICLPTDTSEDFAGRIAVATGWGAVNVSDEVSCRI